MKKYNFLIVAYIIIGFIFPESVFSQSGWFPLSAPNDNYWAIQFIGTQTGYATVRGTNYIRKTTDAGQNWSQLPVGVSSDWAGLYFINENTGWIGGGGSIRKTTNGGINWIPQTPPNSVLSIFMVNADTGYACGDNQQIAKTINGGSSWFSQSGAGGTHYNCVYFINPNTGWISGEGPQGVIIKTTNGGNLWFNQLTTNQLWSVFFVNSNTGFAAGENVIYKTTNAGTNWVLVSIPVQTRYYSIVFVNDETGYACGNNGTIIKTYNGGSNWVVLNSGSTGFLRKLYFNNADTGYVTTYGGPILKTTTGGVCTPLPPSNLTASAISSSRIDLNWTDNSNNEIGFKIERSTNAGTNWTLRDSVGANIVTYSDTGLTANTAYHYRIYSYNACGNSPYSNIAFAITFPSGVYQYGSEIPKEFKVYPNYPNPFNPVTSIGIDIPKTSFTKLIIYDILGREVAVLVNEYLSAGSYSVTWDASAFPSSVYFYKVYCNDFSDSKRMILMK